MDAIGLTRGTVKVVDHHAEWEPLFDQEKRRLQKAIGKYVHDIQHIGSTAVPGLAAKPIIDMIASVDDLAVYKQLIRPLATLGYEFMPERVFKDRVFFPKGPRQNRTHHLSLVVKDSAGWETPIRFRDYLIAHPNERGQYQRLKKELAVAFAHDRAAYTAAKAKFIEDMLQKQ